MMPKKSINSLLSAFALCTFVAACSDLPDSNQAMKEAEQVASNDAISESLFKVNNIVRENGWAEANRYSIRFNYSLVSQKKYPEMLVEQLKLSADEIKAMSDSDLSALKMQVGLGAMVSGLAEAFGEATPIGLAKSALNKYPEVNKYLSENSGSFKNDSAVKLIALIASYNQLSELGLPDDAPAGYVIPRTVTFSYIKTEKGWVKSQ